MRSTPFYHHKLRSTYYFFSKFSVKETHIFLCFLFERIISSNVSVLCLKLKMSNAHF